MSFWKHEPPNPTEARKNLGPTRVSQPTAWATSSMLAPVASHMADSALIEEIRWASMALAANLDSSDDQTPTVRMRSTLRWYKRIRKTNEVWCGLTGPSSHRHWSGTGMRFCLRAFGVTRLTPGPGRTDRQWPCPPRGTRGWKVYQSGDPVSSWPRGWCASIPPYALVPWTSRRQS